MIKEAIVLAGGLGTRLRDAVPDLPKCMAPVAGRPFISHIIDYWRMQGIQRFVFSLGYKGQFIADYLSDNYSTLDYTIVSEQQPLGTGGAIWLASQEMKEADYLVVNGDTMFKANLAELASFHSFHKAECTLALKPMKEFNRYGVVETSDQGFVNSFKEKQYYPSGSINGGVYLLNKNLFASHSFPEKFSFEKDYLEVYYCEGNIYGLNQNGYFIDIGIPEDYLKAQIDLQKKDLHLSAIDKTWTLFLDRDGVINEEKVGDYIKHWGEFIFSKGVLDAFKILTDHFKRIIIISNQRGIAKQLMTEADLKSIHYEMQREVEIIGGKIDKIYYCSDYDNKSFCRKPNPGMAYAAISDFPDIDLNKTIMVGNKPSDMQFGRNAGVFTVFLTTTNPEQSFPHADIDLKFDTLLDFAKAL